MLSRSFLRNASTLQRKTLLLNAQVRSASLTPEERLKYISTPPYVLPFPLHKKLVAPAMTYISGEEMTRYTMELILEQWVRPHIDISKWEFFKLFPERKLCGENILLHGTPLVCFSKRNSLLTHAVRPASNKQKSRSFLHAK